MPTKEKKEEKVALEKLELDYASDRYDAIVLASLWAKHLRTREELRYAPHAEVIRAAVTDILGGKVSKEEVFKAIEHDMLAKPPVEEVKKPAKPSKEEAADLLE